MDTPHEEIYFTIGELASTFGITNQSLIYYDRIGLLSPEFVAENGYRHYSMRQYRELEIIVNLRTLGISLADIRLYLKNRSRENLSALLAKKEASCKNIIRESERICRSIEAVQDLLADKETAPVGRCLLQWQPRRTLRVEPFTAGQTPKDWVSIMAKASHRNLHKRAVLEKQLGWYEDCQAFLCDQAPRPLACYTVLPAGPVHEGIPVADFPAGLYVLVYTAGSLPQARKAAATQINAFLATNQLTPCGPVYVEPIQNYWLTSDPAGYVTRFLVPVAAQ